MKHPPPRYSVAPLHSFAVDRPGGKEPTVQAMLADVIAAVQPRWRKKTLRAVFKEAREIDRLAEMMDSPSPAPASSPKALLRLARAQRRLKL
jgi:hypothetical protein